MKDHLIKTTVALPSKGEVVDIGFNKAKQGDFTPRRSLRDPHDDLYFSGWMDCFDWMTKHLDK